MRKLRKAIPLALAMSVALTMTPIRASAEEPTQVQAEQSDLVEENESLSDEADKDNEGYELVFEDEFTGNQLDRTVWNVEKHEKGWVNEELQEYVDSDRGKKEAQGAEQTQACRGESRCHTADCHHRPQGRRASEGRRYSKTEGTDHRGCHQSDKRQAGFGDLRHDEDHRGCQAAGTCREAQRGQGTGSHLLCKPRYTGPDTRQTPALQAGH